MSKKYAVKSKDFLCGTNKVKGLEKVNNTDIVLYYYTIKNSRKTIKRQIK